MTRQVTFGSHFLNHYDTSSLAQTKFVKQQTVPKIETKCDYLAPLHVTFLNRQRSKKPAGSSIVCFPFTVALCATTNRFLALAKPSVDIDAHTRIQTILGTLNALLFK